MTKTVDLATFERCVVWGFGGVGALAATFAGLAIYVLASGQGRAAQGAELMFVVSLAVALIAFGVALVRLRQLRRGATSCWSPWLLRGLAVFFLAAGLVAVGFDTAEGFLRQVRDVSVAVVTACGLFRAAAHASSLAAASPAAPAESR